MSASKTELKRIEKLVAPYRVAAGTHLNLADFDPADTADFNSGDKGDARAYLAQGIEWLAEQQAMLAAQRRWGVLLVFQARDAAGKDSTIRHVMTGLNPQGCNVTSFKEPSSTELDHDFLWRYHRRVPAQGEIGIFNRSHYEDVLVVRVHEELLRSQHLPEALITEDIWERRLEDINAFEAYLARNGIAIVKFFLNVSKDEQKSRLMDRLNEPEKHWKFSSRDVHARRYWDDYTAAFEDAIGKTSTPHAPWYVVPADKKWFTRMVVASAIVDTIAKLDVAYPTPDEDAMREIDLARKELDGE